MPSEFARKLRREPTDTERRMWLILRDRRFTSLKFRRQHPIGPYVVDFACTLYALAVEIDGGQHTAEADAERTRYLKSEGWHVIRFWNHDVLQRTESVKEALLATIANLKPRTLK